MNIKEIIKKHKDRQSINTSVVKELAQVLLEDATQSIISDFNDKIKELTTSFNNEVSNLEESFKVEIDKIQMDLNKKGDKGDMGEKGDCGECGIDGKDGLNGKNGLNGLDGRDGKDGKDGIDGLPDKPEEIANKLNTLEEKVERKVIKGLDKIIENLGKRIQETKRGGGGGGIGNPTSESFTMNGSSTTFTLANNVQASGKAIWVYNNGQWLVPTTHYSISGKVGTLTFTPQNGEIIDVLYFRA